MSVELVTGYYGVGEDGEPKRHVSSAEDGARQAGTLGLGSYVLSTGSKLSATMEDANTLVVADGDVMMNGRHVSLPDPTSFTIPTGVHGQKVSNLAVLRYEKAADSVESVTPVVLTGEPSADAPTDPAHNEGSILDGDSPVDFPLYRVVTDGINAGDPEPLFDVLMSMADLRDSVSQATEDTGWQYLWQSGTGFVQYRRIGPLVYLWWFVPQASTRYWTCSSHLPEGCRPYGNTFLPAVLASSTGYITNNVAFAFVDALGIVGFQAGAAVGGANNRGCGCFVALQA